MKLLNRWHFRDLESRLYCCTIKELKGEYMIFHQIKILILTLILSLGLFAAESNVNVIEMSTSGTEINLNSVEFSLGKIQLEQGEFDRIVSNLNGSIRLLGVPELPTTTVMVAVPKEGNIWLNINSTESQIISDINLTPVIPEQIEAQEMAKGYFKDNAIYSDDNWYPRTQAIAHPRVTMRDVTMIPVEISPFQYNPVTKELRFTSDLSIQVQHEQNLVKADHPTSKMFEPFYRATVENYEVIASDNFQRPSYLFVARNNLSVLGILQSVIDWKHQKGFDIQLLTTGGVVSNTTSAIKNYIQTAYDNGVNPPEFICIVGDATNNTFSVPTWTESWSNYSGEGDHPYTELSGEDNIADAFLGRLTFQTTTELLNIVSKILNYEKMPDMINTQWFTRAVLIGDPNSSGQSTVETMHYVDELLQDNGFSGNYTAYTGGFTSTISTGINAGVSYMAYRGWLGMSGWGNSNTDALNNGSHLPFVSIITCGTGSFQNEQYARSERFLTVGTPSVPKGAIGAVGTATTGTHTLYNNCVTGGIFHGIFNENLVYAGAALARGWYNLNLSYPNDEHNYVKIFSHWNNLMGDPGVELWTGVPQYLSVEHADTVIQSADYLLVSVLNMFSVPIADAWVTVLQGEDIVFESGYTDANGEVAIPIASMDLSDITVTVSKHDYIPVQNTITVINTDVTMDYSGLTLSGESNSDGALNPAETANLSLSFNNSGIATAENLSVDIVSLSSEIEFTVNQVLGQVAIGADATTTPISITIPANYPGNSNVEFRVIYSGDNFSWTDYIAIPISGPALQIDGIFENAETIPSFDPGEITTLSLSAENFGLVATSNLTGTLTSLSNDVVVLEGTKVFTDAGLDEFASNSDAPFSIQLDGQLTIGTSLPMSVLFSDDSGFENAIQFMLPIGTPSATDPLGPDAYGYMCYDYNDLAYALAPVYTWYEIAPSLGGAGLNTGIIDSGNNDEEMATVTIPFNVGFYGETYTQISIGSNGYIGFGESDVANFRNWRIPGPLGPSAMVAGFWDDLYMNSTSGIYTYYDQVRNQYIIEWDRMLNAFGSSIETFQILLLDPLYYNNADGNSDIIVQYKTFNNVDAGSSSSSSHGNYSTIGIEDQTSTMGLEYTFNNTYPMTANVLDDETAIRFTTRTDAIVPCPGWARSDVNHDGQRNVQDLIVTINYLLNGSDVGECEYWAADMSGDSLLNVGDVVMMVNSLLGLNGALNQANESGEIIIENGEIWYIPRNSGAFEIEINATDFQAARQIPGYAISTSKFEDLTKIIAYKTGDGISKINLGSGHGIQIRKAQESLGKEGLVRDISIAEIPEEFELISAFPNPFNPSITFSFKIAKLSHVQFQVYNTLGQQIYNEISSDLTPGAHSVRWNGNDNFGSKVGSGLYFVKISNGENSIMEKVTLLK
jgi:hypothetical protein